MKVFALTLFALGLLACDPRHPTVSEDNPRFGRFEAPAANNACSTNADCVVSGCSNEICAAESLVSTCEVISDKPQGFCGCVQGDCIWYSVAPEFGR